MLLAVPVIGARPAESVHQPPPPYDARQAIILELKPEGPIEWASLYVRGPQESDFRAVAFADAGAGLWKASIEASLHKGRELGYYLVYKSGGAFRYLPETAPAELFSLRPQPLPSGPPPISGPAPAGPAPAAGPATGSAFPLRLEGSGDLRVFESAAAPGDNGFHHTENLSLDYRNQGGKVQLDLTSRLSYTDQPLPGLDSAGLSNLRLEAVMGAHTLRFGDLSVAESEFSIAGSGRRGMEYQFAAGGFTLHAFTLATQQLSGFRGIGIPPSGAGLFGGALGYALPGRELALKVVYASGTDDPSQGVASTVLPLFKPRQGQILTFVGLSDLFQGAWHMEGELALSHMDSDTTDTLPAVSGTAWRIQSRLSLGSFSLDAHTRQVDKAFDTIGAPFFTADRSSLGFNAAYSLGIVHVEAGYTQDSTKGSNDPLDILAKNRQINAGLALTTTGGLTVRLGITRSDQEASQNNLALPEGALVSTGLSASVDVVLGAGGTLSASFQSDDIKSDAAPDRSGRTLAFTLGGSFGDGKRLSLVPGISYSAITNPVDNSQTTTLAAYLNGRVGLWGEHLFVTASGFYNRLAPPAGDDATSLGLDGGLLLETGTWLPDWGRLGLSLRAGVSSSRFGGVKTDDARVYIRAEFAFGR